MELSIRAQSWQTGAFRQHQAHGKHRALSFLQAPASPSVLTLRYSSSWSCHQPIQPCLLLLSQPNIYSAVCHLRSNETDHRFVTSSWEYEAGISILGQQDPACRTCYLNEMGNVGSNPTGQKRHPSAVAAGTAHPSSQSPVVHVVHCACAGVKRFYHLFYVQGIEIHQRICPKAGRESVTNGEAHSYPKIQPDF